MVRPMIALLLIGCSEYDIKQLCVNTRNAFDVEEVSFYKMPLDMPEQEMIVMEFDPEILLPMKAGVWSRSRS